MGGAGTLFHNSPLEISTEINYYSATLALVWLILYEICHSYSCPFTQKGKRATGQAHMAYYQHKIKITMFLRHSYNFLFVAKEGGNHAALGCSGILRHYSWEAPINNDRSCATDCSSKRCSVISCCGRCKHWEKSEEKKGRNSANISSYWFVFCGGKQLSLSCVVTLYLASFDFFIACLQ